MADMC